MESILLAQFIAHIVADFFAQPECVSVKKRQNGFRSWHLYAHASIVFATSALATPSLGFVLWAGAIAVSHLATDAAKGAVERKTGRMSSAPFFADQILHLIVIWGAVSLYMRTGGAVPACYHNGLFTTHDLILAAGFLLCLKPANVLIRVCLGTLPTVKESLRDEGLQRAGRWIGCIERAMAFVLVLLGQFTAIGFIIAAKSVLRYDKTDKTEYVLIGTLVSFAVAFALGVGITSGFFENVINIISCNI